MRSDKNNERPTPDRLAALRAMSYGEYLSTPEWRRCRDRALVRAGWRCQWRDCEGTAGRLEVHHRSYEHLGAEPDDDLVVLCYGHHHGLHARLEHLRRLHWRVIRDVINSGTFAGFGDFVEAVKARFGALHITVDPHELNEMLSAALREVAIDVPTHPTRVSVQDSPAHISEQEARDVLAELHLTDFVRSLAMPRVRLVPRQVIDKHKALDLVLREITSTMERCDALEARVEAEKAAGQEG